MSEKPHNPFQFWQELKHRNILHIMTVYTAMSFGLLEFVDIISGPLNFSDRILKSIMIFGVIGFPIAIFLSWFFVSTKNGIKRRISHQSAQWKISNLAIEEEEVAMNGAILPFDDLVSVITGTTEAIKKGNEGKRRERILSVSSLIIIISAIVLFLFYSGKAIPFTERNWILISDFENLTDEAIFDHSLITAFSISISQSRYINVITRQRMYETLKRMSREDVIVIDEGTGREIAIREGVKVCINPSISKVGDQYILAANIKETDKEGILSSYLYYAKSQDEIIDKLDQLSRKIRRTLGESRYDILGQGKSLERVTTTSLEALEEYSLGHKRHINLDFENAVIHYENAIRIDSNFTSAKASLGNILFEKFDREKGREWLEKAIISIDDLTTVEKYSILAFYAANIEMKMDKAIEYIKTITELYPDISTPHNNLGFYFQSQGNYEKAVEEYKMAVQIDPYLMLSYGGLIWTYLQNIGQMDSALVWSKRMIKYGPDNPWSYFYLGSSYVGLEENANAEEAYLKAKELNPLFLTNHYRLAYLYRIQGEYEKAIELLKEMLQINNNEAPVYYILGILYELNGNTDLSRQHFLRFKDYADQWEVNFPQNPLTFIALGTVMTRLGEKEAGWEKGKKAIELDSTIHIRYAELLAVQDKKREALDHLGKALENGYRDLVMIKLNPDLYLLNSEVRFQALINEYFSKKQ